jgi:hypothetical protein
MQERAMIAAEPGMASFAGPGSRAAGLASADFRSTQVEQDK